MLKIARFKITKSVIFDTEEYMYQIIAERPKPNA